VKEDLSFEHGGAKLASCPGRHQTSLRPCCHLINVFCVEIVVKKCRMSSPSSLLLFCTAQQQDTFGAYEKLHICTACCLDSQME